MVQIIPEFRQESSTDKLFKGLSRGVGSASELIPKHYQQKKIGDLLQKEYPDSKYHQMVGELYKQGVDPDHIQNLSKSLLESEKFQNKQRMDAQKSQENQRKKREDAENYGRIIDELEDLKSYAGTTDIPFTKSWGGGKIGFNRNAVQKRQMIRTLSKSLGTILKEMLVSGNINQKEFDTYMQEVPLPEDSERVYQGKLDAFRKILDIESPENIPTFKNKQAPKKKISKSTANKIYDEAGGDIAKAEARAAELGYEF